MQEKEILISSLSQKIISPKPGQSWKAFTVYQILANDGNTYETTDNSFYQSLSMGQTIKIKFEASTKNVGGRIYTSYKIITDKPRSSASTEIILHLNKMESNIIEAIRKMIEPQPKLEEHNDYVDIDIEPKF